SSERAAGGVVPPLPPTARHIGEAPSFSPGLTTASSGVSSSTGSAVPVPTSRREPQLLVVGSAMTDMVVYARALPEAGETVVGDSFALGFGGKGANQAVMCALLGASVSFVGCVGEDIFGDMTLENFESFGIDASRVSRTAAAASGVAPIWVDAGGENRIIIVPGANDLLDPVLVEAAVG